MGRGGEQVKEGRLGRGKGGGSPGRESGWVDEGDRNNECLLAGGLLTQHAGSAPPMFVDRIFFFTTIKQCAGVIEHLCRSHVHTTAVIGCGPDIRVDGVS